MKESIPFFVIQSYDYNADIHYFHELKSYLLFQSKGLFFFENLLMTFIMILFCFQYTVLNVLRISSIRGILSDYFVSYISTLVGHPKCKIVCWASELQSKQRFVSSKLALPGRSHRTCSKKKRTNGFYLLSSNYGYIQTTLSRLHQGRTGIRTSDLLI